MTGFIDKYSKIWGNDPKQLMAEYDYQSELTQRLDALNPDDFDNQNLPKDWMHLILMILTGKFCMK